MSDAPERIWAFQSDGGQRGWLHTQPPQAIIDIPTAYVRADLHDALTEERDRLAKANAELLAGLRALVNAKAIAGVRNLVAGWNGENRPDGPYKERHPKRLGATLPKTDCGSVYELDEAMQSARALLDKHKATSTEREGGQ